MYKWANWCITHHLTWVLYVIYFLVQVPKNITIAMGEMFGKIIPDFNYLRESIKEHIEKNKK